MDRPERLADQLKVLRTARGWSQTQAARHAGVAQTVLSRLERGGGKQPSLGVLQRLADTFGVNLEQLTGSAPLPMEVVMATPEGLHARTVNYVRPANLPRDFIASTPEGIKEVRLTTHRAATRASELDKMEMLLLRQTGAEGYTVADFDAARSVLRDTYTMVPTTLPPERVVEAVLQVARALRVEGLPASTTSVLAGLAYSLLDGAATESPEPSASPTQP